MASIDRIHSALKTHEPVRFQPETTTRQAAVAVVVAENAQGCSELLFIQRALKDGDPWSGHMAFPGGHRDPEDANLRAAAERETMEEIGLDLQRGTYLGALDHQRAMPRGRELDMLIAPHVFAIEHTRAFEPNYEVDDVVWAPLETLMSNRLHDTMTIPLQGKPTIFNGYRLSGGHFVWGLTYRMLKQFFATITRDWEPPDEL